MEEYTQITLTEWLSWKEDIRQRLQETAGNFVHIGYRLKQIRDSGMYDGCQDIFEFAQKEYGLSKSTVSRFIAINEKFSEGGNSLELRAEFRGIGSSKLSEMLTLPDADCMLITERTTVKEIRELKEFNRQEPPEDALEGEAESCCDVATESPEAIVNTEAEADPETVEKAPGQQEANRLQNGKSCRERTFSRSQENDNTARTYTPLQKCIIDFFSNGARRQALCQVMDILTGEVTEGGLKDAAEAVNPGDYCTHKKGLVFLFLYDWQQGVKYKLMTAPEPISMSWTEFLREIQEIYLPAYESRPEDVWVEFYEKPEKMPEKPERQQDASSQEAKAAPERETAGEALAGEPQPAGREEPESCCDVATETPSAIVNTEAEADPETEEYCQDCRFAHPESQAKRIAYASVCEECTEGSNYQPGKAPEEQEEETLASELERQLREQVIDLTEELRSRVRLTVNPRPLEMVEARSAHAAARKIMALVDRIMDIKESEQEKLEGQMSIEDWENEL